nr:putative retrotransposon Gag domain, aspartic peptidase domain protein [Tanacetum cinerariifolium]
IIECLSKDDLVETTCRTEDPFRDKSVTSGIRARFEAMAIKIEKNAASGSTVIDENRGRNDLRQNPKKRGTRDHEDTGGVGEEVSTLHQTIEDLQADVALCKRSLASGGDNNNHGPKIDVPKPSPFMEKQEAKVVDDFLWEMEQYLKGVNVVDDASKIKMAT